MGVCVCILEKLASILFDTVFVLLALVLTEGITDTLGETEAEGEKLT